MRKFLYALVFSVISMFSVRAELHVDIVAGGTEPIAIAVQKFETVGKVSSSDAKMLREVVENDLKRTAAM